MNAENSLNGSSTLQNPAVDEENIDIKKLVFTFLRNWYWFVLALLITLSGAYLYNRYTTPVYEVGATLLMEEERTTSPFSSGGGMAQGNIFQGLGVMGSMLNIHNQIVLLSSTPIVARTLDELDFEVSYYAVGKIAVAERYHDIPFQIIWDRSHPQIINADFDLKIRDDGIMELSIRQDEGVSIYSYTENQIVRRLPDYSFEQELEAGSRINCEDFCFTILLNEHYKPGSTQDYKFRFHTMESLIRKYRGALEVQLNDKMTSIIRLTLRDRNVRKAQAFLNKLTEVYQIDNLEKKNENANRTIQFISSQLESISDSLIVSENMMENFQSAHQVLDISMQSQQLMEQMRELDKERVAMETQNKYYHYLRNYIYADNEGFETAIAPSAMGISDPLLNNLILQLNTLITEKASQTTSIREDSNHPMIRRLNAQIESVKNSLRENVDNILTQSDSALESLNQRIRTFEAQVRRLPATERNYVNIERKYKLNNETYTFLLQKLSDAQIAKASNIPDSQLIEEPQMAGSGPVEPKKSIIYAVALLLGLGIPAGIIMLKGFFNNKILSQDDIESITSFPIIGHVFHNEGEYGGRTLVLDKPNSPATEPYRAIRTKLK
ncbi:MAG: GNVR domain-containing protein, partial [Mariniphaga sp.]|nr:GNVR domain-containing protein [Mariniphaga sp.]